MTRLNKLYNIGPQLLVAITFVTFFMIIFMQYDISLNFVDIADYQCLNNKNSNFVYTLRFRDNYRDLYKHLDKISNSINKPFEHVIVKSTIEHAYNPTLADVLAYSVNINDTNLGKFKWSMRKHSAYITGDPIMPKLLKDLANLPILDIVVKPKNVQIQIQMQLPDQMYAIFRPMRFPRDRQANVNHFYYADYERHHSEIAAFHLDKVLGFNKALPVSGRLINVTRDIKAHASPGFRQTIFTSPANNSCFWGKCTYYCDVLYPVCGKGEMMEGSMTIYITDFALRTVPYPWHRIARPFGEKLDWEIDPNYCDKVRQESKYKNTTVLLDLIDMSIFDFLIQNGDRRSYSYFKIFGDDASPLFIGNVKGFGKAFTEDFSILTPLMQCCSIKESTLRTLLSFHNGRIGLGETLRNSLVSDPLNPVLWEPYYIAMDRRLEMVLKEIRKCILKFEHNGQRHVESSRNFIFLFG